MSDDKITFKCNSCGSTTFIHPSDPKPDDVITCNGCGATGRYGDVQAAAIRLAKDHVQEALGDAFKGLKGWTVTKK